jgi:hypothetical protein
VYRNTRGVLAPVSDQLGKDLLAPKVSRAAAVADYDNDGYLDVLVSNNGGGIAQVEEAKGGMSYQSSQDPRLHFGLWKAAQVDNIQVTWPSGAVDRVTNLKAGRVITIREDTLHLNRNPNRPGWAVDQKNDKSRCIKGDTAAFNMVRRGGLEPPRDCSR